MKISLKKLSMNKFLVFGLGKAFLDITPEVYATQEKIKLDFIKKKKTQLQNIYNMNSIFYKVKKSASLKTLCNVWGNM